VFRRINLPDTAQAPGTSLGVFTQRCEGELHQHSVPGKFDQQLFFEIHDGMLVALRFR
jgi:hypothetical protein